MPCILIGAENTAKHRVQSRDCGFNIVWHRWISRFFFARLKRVSGFGHSGPRRPQPDDLEPEDYVAAAVTKTIAFALTGSARHCEAESVPILLAVHEIVASPR